MEAYFKLKFIEEIMGYIILGVLIGVPILILIMGTIKERICEFFNKEDEE